MPPEDGCPFPRARSLDPLLGRFPQPDGLDPLEPGVGTNRHAPADNDPIDNNDPRGRSWLGNAATSIGTAIGDRAGNAYGSISSSLGSLLGAGGTGQMSGAPGAVMPMPTNTPLSVALPPSTPSLNGNGLMFFPCPSVRLVVQLTCCVKSWASSRVEASHPRQVA